MNISGQAVYLEMDPLTDADIASEKAKLAPIRGGGKCKTKLPNKDIIFDPKCCTKEEWDKYYMYMNDETRTDERLWEQWQKLASAASELPAKAQEYVFIIRVDQTMLLLLAIGIIFWLMLRQRMR